jgi:hypothetical protein
VRTKVVVVVLVAALLLYLVLLGQRAVLLIASGTVVGAVLGAALLVLPVPVLWTTVRELHFGSRTEVMARELEAVGGLPVDDLPRTPAGRVEREAADAAFERYRAEAEAAPDDWAAWFRLACAYDAARDRRRARAAMRRAITLHSRG